MNFRFNDRAIWRNPGVVEASIRGWLIKRTDSMHPTQPPYWTLLCDNGFYYKCHEKDLEHESPVVALARSGERT